MSEREEESRSDGGDGRQKGGTADLHDFCFGKEEKVFCLLDNARHGVSAGPDCARFMASTGLAMSARAGCRCEWLCIPRDFNVTARTEQGPDYDEFDDSDDTTFRLTA